VHTQILFKQFLKKNSGRSDKREIKPWACPIGGTSTNVKLHEKFTRDPLRQAPRNYVDQLLDQAHNLSVPSASPVPSSRPGPSSSHGQSSSPVQTAGPVQREKRTRKECLYVENKGSDEEDLTSESEQEWTKDEGDSKNSEKEMETKKTKIRDQKKSMAKMSTKTYSDTDDEEEDTEELRAERKKEKAKVRQRMALAKDEAPEGVQHYEPDEVDIEMEKKWYLSSIAKCSTAWQMHGEYETEEIRKGVLEGEIFGGKNQKIYQKYNGTAAIKQLGLRKLLSLMQEDMRVNNPTLLVNNQIHLWQFFRYKREFFLEVPPNITNLVEHERSHSTRQQIQLAFMQLTDCQIEFITTQQGASLFNTRNHWQTNLTDEEMKVEGRNERNDEMKNLEAIRLRQKIGKPFGAITKSKAQAASDREEFSKMFENCVLPDPAESIKLYLEHESTKNLLKSMVDKAMSGELVTRQELHHITTGFLKRQIVKNPYRREVWGSMTRQDYLEGYNMGPAKYPYTTIDQPGTSAQTDFGVLDDPYDMKLEGASFNKKQKSQFMSRIIVTIKKHKTQGQFTCYIWFSNSDQVYMKCYEALPTNYMIRNNIKYDNDTPFFINHCGEAKIHKSSQPLNFGDYAKINGLPRFTAKDSRSQFTRYIKKQESVVIKEAEQYSCHSEHTAEKSYVGSTYKMNMAGLGSAWYREEVMPSEEQVKSSSGVYTDDAQSQRFKAGFFYAMEGKLKIIIDRTTQFETKTPTKDRVITDEVTNALYEAVIQSTVFPVTKNGNLTDIFLTNRTVVRKENISILLRMVHMLPPSLSCIKILKKNLIQFT